MVLSWTLDPKSRDINAKLSPLKCMGHVGLALIKRT